MSDVLIRVEGLGKRYRISHQRTEPYTALRDVFADKLRGLFQAGRRSVERPTQEDFWALKDISFEVRRGEVVGIIGRNGAGKSTLLKILSRITDPTEGRVELDGRVASLLEVGTGFHPELTGRENIYLNGAILGMSRAEIMRKFDEIVAFAEVEKFLDTPVKRFSSGMYVRLAFSVAAHLEPEILIVDEVLAVGDAEFQKKCLGKMHEVSKGGRTVLFVSHNMGAIQSLCASGLLLEGGGVAFRGQSAAAVSRYLDDSRHEEKRFASRSISSSLSLIRFEIDPIVVRHGTQLIFNLALLASREEVISDLALLIHSPSGERAALIDLRSPNGPYRLKAGDTLVLRSMVSAVPFVEVDFDLGLYVDANSVCTSIMNLLTFSVLPGESSGGVVSREPQYRGMIELGALVEGHVC